MRDMGNVEFYTLTGERADVTIRPLAGSAPYTNDPAYVRIYGEETGDAWPWHIDGIDARGCYTETVCRFSTRKEAVEYLPVFVAKFSGEG